MKPTRIFDILDNLLENYPKIDMFAKRDGNGWKTYSTQDYSDYAYIIATALLEKGYKKGDKVVTIMNNRPGWNFMDMGITLAGMIHVPIYPTLNPEEYKYILNHCDCKCIVFGVESIIKRVAPILPEVEQHPDVYSIENIENMDSGDELVRLGKENLEKWLPVIEENKRTISTDDICTIIYTSGTTGQSKGVMLSHGNFCHNFIQLAETHQILDNHAKILSFLPLSHVYERLVNYHYQYIGASIYYAGSLATIAKDMHDMQADGFCGVPRVFEMIYDKLVAAGKNLKGVKHLIYHWALRIGKKYNYDNHNPLYMFKYELADKLVYSKWRAMLGGHEMLVISGGSSLSDQLIRLFTAAKIRIYEGYGLTETSPVIAVNNPKKKIIKPGCVGEILGGIEFKLGEDGEILTKGPCLMKGYYKDEAYTQQVIDNEGWFHTGDIGTLVEGRYLKITDRKKEIFKLSAGKYVAPQVIEKKLRDSEYIDNLMVIGENEKFASALISPAFSQLEFYCKKHKITIPANHEDFIKLPEVEKLIAHAVAKVNKTLAEHEQIKRFRIVPDSWNIGTELSQTMKLKRKFIYSKYETICREIYNYDTKVVE